METVFLLGGINTVHFYWFSFSAIHCLFLHPNCVGNSVSESIFLRNALTIRSVQHFTSGYVHNVQWRWTHLHPNIHWLTYDWQQKGNVAGVWIQLYISSLFLHYLYLIISTTLSRNSKETSKKKNWRNTGRIPWRNFEKNNLCWNSWSNQGTNFYKRLTKRNPENYPCKNQKRNLWMHPIRNAWKDLGRKP